MGKFTVVHWMWRVHIKAAIGRCFDTLRIHQHAPSEYTWYRNVDSRPIGFGDYLTPGRIDIVVQACLDISTPSLLWNSLISWNHRLAHGISVTLHTSVWHTGSFFSNLIKMMDSQSLTYLPAWLVSCYYSDGVTKSPCQPVIRLDLINYHQHPRESLTTTFSH